MCIIAICEKRKLTEQEFMSCWKSNSHGFGYAYWTGEEVIMKKGIMDMKEAWAAYQPVPVPHIAHFRIASAGEVCPELTHPFLCTPKSGLVLEHHGTAPVLFHNGTVSEWRSLLLNAIFQTKVIPTGAMSDSRAMAVAVSVLGGGILTMYASHKWVLVVKDGFIKVGDWIEAEGGVLFSNGGFRSYTETAVTQSWAYGQGVRSYWPGARPTAEMFREDDSQATEGYEEENKAWRESARSIKIAKRGGVTVRACTTCAHYDGDVSCEIKGLLKDDVACSQYILLRIVDKLEEHEPSCKTCGNVSYGGTLCMTTGKPLKDDYPCKKWVSKESVEKDVCAAKPKNMKNFKAIKNDIGAKAVIKNGQLVSVQSNFLDRLKNKYNS